MILESSYISLVDNSIYPEYCFYGVNYQNFLKMRYFTSHLQLEYISVYRFFLLMKMEVTFLKK